MRFLLVVPPYVADEAGRGIVPTKAMLPVGPLSVASALIERGHEVRAVDYVFTADWQQPLADMMASGECDHVLLSCHTVRNITVCNIALNVIRRLQPDVHVTLGGNIGTELGVEESGKLGLDVQAMVRGYGHAPAVIDALIAKQSGDLHGLAESRLLAPAVHLLGEEVRRQYRRCSSGKYPLVAVQFGCRWNCGYCSAKMGSRSMIRNFAEVEEEIDQARAMGYTHIWCVDNIVTIESEQLIRFDTACRAAGLTWSGMTRPELAAEQAELFTRLAACTEIAMGIESASDDELKAFCRGARKDYRAACAHAVQNVRASGIRTNAFVMLGGPAWSLKSFFDLIGFLRFLAVDTVSWSFFNPTPRTVLAGNDPAKFGFYRWPLGGCEEESETVVQAAMILSGIWWSGWTLSSSPCYRTEEEFGIRFEGRTLYQRRTDRSSVGDLWSVWRERR